jgi:hypothetical protein
VCKAVRNAAGSTLVTQVVLGTCLIAASLVLGGCGSSSDANSETTTSTKAKSEQNVRLTPAAWNDFTAVREHARTVNNTAIATFRTCRSLIYSSASPEKVNACLGNSTATVVSTGKDTLKALEAQSKDIAGACADANTQLHGYVKVYVASIQAVQSAVDRGNVTAAQPHIDNALLALEHTRAANTKFETACKPAT